MKEAEKLPDYPFKAFDFKNTPINQLDQFEFILRGAQKKGIVGDFYAIPDNKEEKKKHKIHIQTVTSRLWLLGYLQEKIAKNKVEEVYENSRIIQQAVEEFKKEAGLPCNDSIDSDTWFALDSLVSFESDTKLEKWIKEGKPLPVLQRAVRLRLFCLGLLKNKPVKEMIPLTKKDFRPFLTVVRMFQLSEEDNLIDVIDKFYKEFHGYQAFNEWNKNRKITPDFFASLNFANEQAKYDDEKKFTETIEYVTGELSSKSKIEKAWAYMRNKGLKLWDGFKRVWGWIKRLGKKVFGLIEENVFRAFFRYASKGFRIVKKAMDCVLESVQTYIKGTLPQNNKNIQVAFNKDFDYLITINSRATDQQLSECKSAIIKQAKIFSIGSQIIGGIFSVFKNVATAIIGWPRLLLALVKGLKQLKPLYLQLKSL